MIITLKRRTQEQLTDAIKDSEKRGYVLIQQGVEKHPDRFRGVVVTYWARMKKLEE